MSIVVDANVMIASLDRDNVHHDKALAALDSLEEDAHGKIAEIHRLTLAEVLVDYDDPHMRTDLYGQLTGVGGLRIWEMVDEEEVHLLIEARKFARVPMPDACVLAAAMWSGTREIMTFDKRLAKAAPRVGVTAIDIY